MALLFKPLIHLPLLIVPLLILIAIFFLIKHYSKKKIYLILYTIIISIIYLFWAYVVYRNIMVIFINLIQFIH
jgi:hypothetical protein